MTVESMSSLPMQATSALAHAAGRLALYGLSVYMRAPLRNTAMTALVVLTAMAGSNLLYGQAHQHKAPLFGTFEARTDTAPAKVAPIGKPKAMTTKKVSAETTGAIAPAAGTKLSSISNDDVRTVQGKLKALNLFTGTVDGLFGPRTSKAIKAFEASIGRPQRGQLTPDIVALITGAKVPAAPVKPRASLDAPVATQSMDVPESTTAKGATAPAKLVIAPPAAGPVATEIEPLKAPAPLAARTSEAIPEATAAVSGEITASTGTETVAMTVPPTKRTVQTIAVRARTSEESTVAVVAAATTEKNEAQEMPATLPAAITEASDGPVAEAAIAGGAPVELQSTTTDPAMDKRIVTSVQRGLNSLGFLHGEITGEADEATAKAIRNFEVYYNYAVTGRVTQNLVKMLIAAGAVI